MSKLVVLGGLIAFVKTTRLPLAQARPALIARSSDAPRVTASNSGLCWIIGPSFKSTWHLSIAARATQWSTTAAKSPLWPDQPVAINHHEIFARWAAAASAASNPSHSYTPATLVYARRSPVGHKNRQSV